MNGLAEQASAPGSCHSFPNLVDPKTGAWINKENRTDGLSLNKSECGNGSTIVIPMALVSCLILQFFSRPREERCAVGRLRLYQNKARFFCRDFQTYCTMPV